MLRFYLIFCLFLVGFGNVNCKECPPCQDAETSIETAKASSNLPAPTLADTAVYIESDAGVPNAVFNATPSEVTEFNLYGRAGFERVNVFEKPDMDSPRLGYMRKGQRIRLGDPKYASKSCPGGWYQVPTGGFVCQGRGMLVGEKPRFLRNAPPEGNFDELDPYRHGFVRKDWTPSYKRLPKPEELWTPPVPDENVPDENAVPLIADAGVPTELEIIPHDPTETIGVDYHKYTKKKFKAVSHLMSRGFWVSVGERLFDDVTRKYYYKTMKGNYVPGEAVHLVKPPEFKGYPVTGETPLPALIVTDRRANFFQLRKDRFVGAGPVERLNSYHVYEIREAGKTQYYKVERERWLKDSQVEFFPLAQPPSELKDKEKWIRIDLSRQTIVAYEGAMPVYATLVSTGRAESDAMVTPKGKFRISFKHLTDDMTGSVGDDETYSVEDVPWVQYLHLNVALHGAFWHSSFGTPRSHGCINLSPADARWLFNWTEPKLPENWHGVLATEKNPGTLVIIEGQTPKKK